jgi:Rrf2 family protein
MITKTTEAAFRILSHLLARKEAGPVSVQRLAEDLGGSPTYLAKVANHLVRGGILSSKRGIQGGLELTRTARFVPLLRVVEVCQGLPAAAYCDSRITAGVKVCTYHSVMADLHEAFIGILGKKNIGDLARCPVGTDGRGVHLPGCRMNHAEAHRAG